MTLMSDPSFLFYCFFYIFLNESTGFTCVFLYSSWGNRCWARVTSARNNSGTNLWTSARNKVNEIFRNLSRVSCAEVRLPDLS